MRDVPDEILKRWNLSAPTPVADTGQAQVWKVRSGGDFAALKLYRRADRGNEAPGPRVLSAWQDRGAVRVIAETDNAVLMEWLSGPSLGDIARDGAPTKAVALLAETSRTLHQAPQVKVDGLKPLHDVFAPLFDCTYAPSCDPGLARNMQRAARLAQTLLDTQPQLVPLHGDLHPDNVILTATGPRVIDAKGYCGDPAFELANALRHPKGMPELVREPKQIAQCLTLYADAMGVTQHRLGSWAAAKCAMSIYWRANGHVAKDTEADLLAQFLTLAG